MTSKQILAVDDSKFMQAIIAGTLQNAGYNVTTLTSGEEALEFLSREKPDLLLLDGVMTGISGYEVLSILRADWRYNLLPIIMITGQAEAEDRFRSLEAGADDYIVKPFNSRELLARVRNTLVRLERSRGVNPLTGLRGNNDIEIELASRLESEKPFCVLYFDINSFKPYNDVYGFTNGDRAIKLVSDIICSAVIEKGTDDDFIGHIGGDDFVVITEPGCGEAIAERVIADFDVKIRELYAEEDREKGCITTHDRTGKETEFSLMGLSAAIIDSRRCEYLSTTELAEKAAELKKRAKNMCEGKSAYVTG